MPIFSTSIDSAFDAESIDTKINDFDENFSECNIDGRPFSEAKPHETQKSYFSQDMRKI